jgi:hypothetical protein
MINNTAAEANHQESGTSGPDGRNPVERIGQRLIDLAGFQFGEADNAVRQIEGWAADRRQSLTSC